MKLAFKLVNYVIEKDVNSSAMNVDFTLILHVCEFVLVILSGIFEYIVHFIGVDVYTSNQTLLATVE